MLSAFAVQRSAVAARWDEVAPFFSAALATGWDELNVEQLYGLLIDGAAILIVARDAAGAVHGALAIEFMNYPNYRVGHVIAIGGRGLVDNAEGWQQVKEWLKREGCRYVQGFASESVARLWRRRGMKTVYQVVRDEL